MGIFKVIKALITKMVNLLDMDKQERWCVLRLCRPDDVKFIRLVEVDEGRNRAPVILEEYEQICSRCGRTFGPAWNEVHSLSA